MGDSWRAMRGKKVRILIERHCGGPVRQKGSHRRYKSPINGARFTYAYHEGAEVNGNIVRKILVEDIGLSVSEAAEEVGK